MIFNKLKRKSITMRINKLIADRPSAESQQKITSLLVIVDIDKLKNMVDFRALANSMGISQDNFTTLAFSDNRKTIKSYKGTLLTTNKIDRKGLVKDNAIKNILDKETDLLINYFKTNKVALELASASANAKFKVGLFNADLNLNDLIIDCSISDFDLFKSETIKYLKVLNKI